MQINVQVFSPPNDQLLPASVNLVIQTVSGSASKCTELAYTCYTSNNINLASYPG